MMNVSFPKPVGSFYVGLHHTSFDVQGREPQKLSLTLYYPADDIAGLEQAPYAFPELLDGVGLSGLLSPCWQGAQVSNTRASFPLVIFSHGYGAYEMSNTALCSNLASLGYIVAAIGHAGEASLTKMPDGQIIPIRQDLREADLSNPEKIAALQAIMAEVGAMAFSPENDAAFIAAGARFSGLHGKNDRIEIWVERTVRCADFLQELNEKASSFLSGKIDFSKGIALTGHSFGGATAIVACRRDARFACGVDIDGGNLEHDFGVDIGKPFLFMGAETTCKMLTAPFLNNSADSYQVICNGVTHNEFTDLSCFPEVTKALGVEAKREAGEVVDIMTKWHASFFKKYLLDEDVSFDGLRWDGVRVLEKLGTQGD